ncbi:MAG: NUDIX hydrolase N-terminal domain-containing protein [Gaiellaceae bacterium MAG52_C11]|nr:NUDIX hydrolase N-terminal domain-containing protein [Candidatus Gaiellasilicea maunaloa]
MEQAWLDWVRRLQAIAQNGLLYTDGPFDRERYAALRAITAEIAAAGGGEPEQLAATFAAQGGYATPKVDVRAVAFREDRILLVRNRDDGLWSPPGGWVEVGERPSQAVEKELREESGYSGRAVKLVGIYDLDLRSRPRWPFHGFTLVILCELESSEPGPLHAAEIDSADFFAEDALPPLSIRLAAEQVRAAFAHERDRTLPSAFD